MWQLYSFLGVFFGSFENVLDKYFLVQENKLNYIVATFCRVFVYVFLILFASYIGLFGRVYMLFDWKIIVLGLLSACNSLSYTYVVKRVEITNVAAIVYLSPLVFLFADIFIVGNHLSTFQILGVLLLSLGGVGLSIDGSTLKIRKEFTPKILGFFTFWLVYNGLELYVFKFFNASQNSSAVTFYANVLGWAGLFIFLFVVINRKTSEIFSVSALQFSFKSIFSKVCDILKTLATAEAVLLATVSQVSAFGALKPVVLFSLTFIFQKIFKFTLQERLGKKNVIWKLSMITILVVGGFLIS